MHLILTKQSDVELIHNIKSWDPALSDHFAVTAEIQPPKPSNTIHEISKRKLSSVNHNALSH